MPAPTTDGRAAQRVGGGSAGWVRSATGPGCGAAGGVAGVGAVADGSGSSCSPLSSAFTIRIDRPSDRAMSGIFFVPNSSIAIAATMSSSGQPRSVTPPVCLALGPRTPMTERVLPGQGQAMGKLSRGRTPVPLRARSVHSGGMRVAVLSDIHGHLPALDAALADVATAGVDRIVVTGDIAAGPMPVPVLERLLGLGERVVWVRGNGDRELYEPTPDPPDPVVPWAAAQLTDALRAHLAGLPLTVTLDVDGLGPTLFCHATPRNDTEVALVDSALARWAEVLADRPEQTVVLGHTHMPFARLANRVLVVNPGSVGMPYGRSGAHWAVLGPGVELRRSTYDVAAACGVLRTGGYPGVEEWLDAYVRQTFGDDEALAVFGPRDGRQS